MDLLDKSPRERDLSTPLDSENSSRAIWWSAGGMLRLAAMVVVAGSVLCAPPGTGVLANSGHQAATKEDSNIDPDAMAALNKMGAYMRTLKAFQVNANVATDKVLDDGQTIEFSSRVDMVMARPNRMRVEVTDDDGHRSSFLTGRTSASMDRPPAFTPRFPAHPRLPN